MILRYTPQAILDLQEIDDYESKSRGDRSLDST